MEGQHFFPLRRESPWKVDGESTGVSSKLKLLEQELLNLEKVGKSNLSKAPSLMRKQAKRYQALAGKIDDLCGRMVIYQHFYPMASMFAVSIISRDLTLGYSITEETSVVCMQDNDLMLLRRF